MIDWFLFMRFIEREKKFIRYFNKLHDKSTYSKWHDLSLECHMLIHFYLCFEQWGCSTIVKGGETETHRSLLTVYGTGAKCHTPMLSICPPTWDPRHWLCVFVFRRQHHWQWWLSLLDRHKTGSCFVKTEKGNKTTLYVIETWRTNSTLSILGIYIPKNIYTCKHGNQPSQVIGLHTIEYILSFFYRGLKLKSDYKDEHKSIL